MARCWPTLSHVKADVCALRGQLTGFGLGFRWHARWRARSQQLPVQFRRLGIIPSFKLAKGDAPPSRWTSWWYTTLLPKMRVTCPSNFHSGEGSTGSRL
eukprot:1189047-Prorocentrum_minimum.AAC.3